MLRWFELSPEAKEEVVDKIRRVLEGEGAVSFAYLFGSFLEGGPFRDVDVGVYLGVETDPIEAAVYAEELSAKLSREVGLPVDVVVLNFAPSWIKRAALEGRPLVVRDEARWAALWACLIDEEYLFKTAFGDDQASEHV